MYQGYLDLVRAALEDDFKRKWRDFLCLLPPKRGNRAMSFIHRRASRNAEKALAAGSDIEAERRKNRERGRKRRAKMRATAEAAIGSA